MKSWIQNELTTGRGLWSIAYRIRGWIGPRFYRFQGSWNAGYLELSLAGLIGVGVNWGRNEGLAVSVGASWLGGAGIGWHPGHSQYSGSHEIHDPGLDRRV
jgi:hypothetical protein